MLSNVIVDQLSKITSVELNYDDNTKDIYIPKTVKYIGKALKKGQVYEIELSDAMLDPSDNTTLVSNWNAGRVPKHKVYVIEILDNMSKMIKVNGVAKEDPTEQFYGWIPYEYFKVLAAY